MDVTIVNVALPSIQHDLHAQMSGLQWVLDAYTLVVASLLMFSGSMSDRFGRRRFFMIGLSIFCAGSLLCSLAHTIGQLIFFRGLQGLGASMLNPVALAVIATVFPEPKARARAVGIWGAVAGISLAIGPLIGGALTQTIGWRSIFWINLPIGLTTIALAYKFIPESKAARARRFDPLGQTLVFLGLAALTYAVIEGPHDHWSSPTIVALFATAAAALLAFLLYEPRRTDPLVDLRFFRSVPFATAAVLGVLSFSCFAAFLFLNTLYLQQSRGLSAFATGLDTLPLAVLMFVCSPLSGRLVARFGPRPSVLFAGIGFFLSAIILTHLTPTTPLFLLLLAYALFGVGLGMINPAISNSAIAGMPLSQTGVAAAIASTSRQVGAAMGVAVAGTVVSISRATGTPFTPATHPIWYAMVIASLLIFAMGWISTTPLGLSFHQKSSRPLPHPREQLTMNN
jgi:EmrB/QacA subfamily drug resistance transporter